MLTKRLARIAECIPQCNVLADVGCDHGYIGIAALERNTAQQVVFIDVSRRCLAKARQNCPPPLLCRSRFVCQDGLADVVADCAVIAGMGGLEILSVLNNARVLPQYLVLQPMRNQYDVRRYLLDGYRVTLDVKFFDGKYYDLILAQRSQTKCSATQLELLFGSTNLARPERDFIEWLRLEQNKLQQILTNCNDAEVADKLHYVNAALQYVNAQPCDNTIN